MEFGLAPALWLILVTVGFVALGAGMAFGLRMWRRTSRDPVVQQLRDDATRDLYAREAQTERNSDPHRSAV